MTAIAWDGEELAADSMSLSASMKYHTSKLYTVEHPTLGKCIVGIAGNERASDEIVDHLNGKTLIVKGTVASGLDASYIYGILIDSKKVVYDVYGDGYVGPALHALDNKVAQGSVWEFLHGAMCAGASAYRAVELAIASRTDCGYDVHTLNWNEIFNPHEGSDNDLPF